MDPAVDPRFFRCTEASREQARARFGLPAEGSLALLVGGSWGIGEFDETVRDVKATGLARCVVVCGQNEELRRRLIEQGVEHVYGWVQDMPGLMHACDVLIQNAGGMTVYEARACGLPVVTYRTLPGHGQTNAEALDEAGVRATFFLLGRMVRQAPSLAREIADAGHEVALHGWGHRAHIALTPGQTLRDLRQGRDEVAGAIGRAPGWYRPPYGVATAATFSACRKLGLRPVLWSAWGRDWTSTATAESVLHTVARDLRGGGTVLLHDSDCTSKPEAWRSTLGALPLLLEHCAQQSWRVGPLREHGLEEAPGRTAA